MRLNAPRNNGLEMEMRKLILGAAAAAMIAGGTVAQAAPVDRAAVPVSNSEELAGGGGATVVLGVLAAALLVFLLVQINDQDGKDVDLPTSPSAAADSLTTRGPPAETPAAVCVPDWRSAKAGQTSAMAARRINAISTRLDKPNTAKRSFTRFVVAWISE
jgi:hypothetical protein